MITLDGSYGEGGGSLVRTALALSVLTGKEFKVINIRSGRPDPGLKAQHLTAIQALKEICEAQTNVIKVGSTELYFKPGILKRGIYNLDIGTAGSISLLVQALILPSLFSPGKITFNLTGGTGGQWQSSVDYLQNVLLPQVQRFVEKINLKILKRGYYPKGGGKVSLEINPRFKLPEYADWSALLEDVGHKTVKIKLINKGKLEQIRGVVNGSTELQEKQVGERIAQAAKGSLGQYKVPINIRIEYSSSLSTGGEIGLWALFGTEGKLDPDNPIIIGSSELVEVGKSSELVGKEAAKKLSAEIDSSAATDKFLEDQLIMFMGLLPGSEISTSKITDHTKTNIYVVEKFLPVKFMVEWDRVKVKKV